MLFLKCSHCLMSSDDFTVTSKVSIDNINNITNGLRLLVSSLTHTAVSTHTPDSRSHTHYLKSRATNIQTVYTHLKIKRIIFFLPLLNFRNVCHSVDFGHLHWWTISYVDTSRMEKQLSKYSIFKLSKTSSSY